MNYDIIERKELKVIGISVRTTNENNQAQQDIGNFWGKFAKENAQEKIPNKINNNIIAAYLDYEKDFTKPYTFILGCEVRNDTEIPDGMNLKTIPSAKYTVIPVIGEMPNALIKTWEMIWKSDIERTYSGDFEEYINGEVKVYIATK